ncbi:iron-sulfur cluster biosynthesis protein [Carnobacteriaceae bacterium zg-ZUI78]|uniref:HesB/YadR/YfhF family protein n=1 Tax=Granulicatella sp. zg-84 TaxID=2678503 RepID=UPI0013C2795B|nr:iron-sulfur cluster biosynthesis protein [Granulicatella sp. zg-84]MBS4749920.1 iron-sulfur cluster biosynthesis protein [Carnobacteriaceae bacterium zg-ZUI78]NEW66409.1 iron-sulfur cluster biosynthesis protein [Granulicatella sp. zg-84]QMI86123.1 iron-sulfur cluster biosynthesis protein [Carnobacteriaceae bacterium zg-84]
MNIIVKPKAQQWYEREMGISKGRGVRFFGQVYGCSPIHESFSLALEVNEPSRPYAVTILNDIPYFIESGDEWFFDGYDFIVDYDDRLDEPKYIYEKRAM